MFDEYAGVRLMSKPPYPYKMAGRGPSGALLALSLPGGPIPPDPPWGGTTPPSLHESPEPGLITSIRTSVPSWDRYVTCRAVTSGTWTLPGAAAQVVTEESRASNRSTTGGVV